MPRTARVAPGGVIFHCLNRGNDRRSLFDDTGDETELASLRESVTRGRPFGGPNWQARTADALGLTFTFRPHGRPKKQQG